MNTNRFSSLNRARSIKRLKDEEFDVLVIGGGITGAGIALDASSRGLKTALIEKNDFAFGTSSRSTKLIHGGLRYLKNFEFALVREVGRERSVLYNNARHIVRPERMLLPLLKNGSLGRYSTELGLFIYDYLAGVEGPERYEMLNRKQTLLEEPILRDDTVTGGGMYTEYRTDDSRLVIEVLKTATWSGALCLNYIQATDFIYDNKKITGVIAHDEIDDSLFNIEAKQIINAAGPWVDELREIDFSLNEKHLQLTKGVHLVFPFEKLPIKQSIYFDAPDKRMLFAIPRGDVTYVGTTDTFYNASIDSPNTTAEDVKYLLHGINHIFKHRVLKPEDVQSSWAGLRPLIHEKGKSPSELSRKDEIFTSDSGLLSIAGGKLTGYRMMASRVVDIAVERLKEDGINARIIDTSKTKLSGGNFASEADIQDFSKVLKENYPEFAISSNSIDKLIFKYGSNCKELLRLSKLVQGDHPVEIKLLLGELEYCIVNEMVCTPSDFFIRRSGALYFDRDHIEKHLPYVEQAMAEHFKWSEAEKRRQMHKFEMEYDEVLSFLNALKEEEPASV